MIGAKVGIIAAADGPQRRGDGAGANRQERAVEEDEGTGEGAGGEGGGKGGQQRDHLGRGGGHRDLLHSWRTSDIPPSVGAPARFRITPHKWPKSSK